MRSRVTRLRELTPRQAQGFEALRRVAQLLDSAFAVPGTSYRVGLDPILGLVPGLGDLVSPLFTLAILWQARELALPRVVLLRMIANVAIDSLLGAIPFIGDLFDFAWKANNKNLALLERHALEERPASAADWAFVAVMIVLLVLIAVIPFAIVGWLIAAAARYLFGT